MLGPAYHMLKEPCEPLIPKDLLTSRELLIIPLTTRVSELHTIRNLCTVLKCGKEAGIRKNSGELLLDGIQPESFQCIIILKKSKNNSSFEKIRTLRKL